MNDHATDNVLSVRNLRVDFDTVHGTTHAVRGVSFELPRGKTLALVGESIPRTALPLTSSSSTRKVTSCIAFAAARSA